ncbi:MAG: ABC transporter ATP-binding protein, partial [Alphaproteobacteria bacterium]|nr:ABC transporter ATP-binding protein [Alphaproteobacteria bacterium]
KRVILDEPDSGADAATRQQIANVMATMPDTTFLFISHQSDFTAAVDPTETTALSAGRIVVK